MQHRHRAHPAGPTGFSALCLGLLVPLVACSGSIAGSSEDNDRGKKDSEDPGNPDDPGVPPGSDRPELSVGEEFNCNEKTAAAPFAQVRRLTITEYANTVRDLLGVNISADAKKLPDARPTVREFNNRSLTISANHLNTFEALATTITDRANIGTLVGKHAPNCSTPTAACKDRFIDEMGKRLFRAPVVDAERTALLKVYAEADKQGIADFNDASTHVLRAMLQSPRFIYRTEKEIGDGGEEPVAPHALATRLSYAIWQSAPDEDLLKAADEDRLKSDSQIEAQIERMLQDPRAKTAAVAFMDDWMDLHRLDGDISVQSKYPDFDEALFADMAQETRALFAGLFADELPITGMFNTQKTTVSRALAEHYGLPDPKDGVNEYDLSDVAERGGLLTQGSMHSLGGVDSSTVRTGLHILHEVLCGEMAPPPADVEVIPTPAKPGESVRQSSEVRVNDASCGACHSQFEPLIWGMTRFRPTGAYNEEDLLGNQLPEDGWIIFPDEGEKHAYDSTAGMMDLLGKSTRVRDCSLLKTVQFFQARSLKETDNCSLKTARDQLGDDASFQDIIRAVALSPGFRNISTVSQ